MAESEGHTRFDRDPVANELSNQVLGAALTVHKHLGPGYLEQIYEQAMCMELAALEIPFERQAPIAVRYRDVEIGHGRIDILVGGRLIVELKAVGSLNDVHTVQALSYLRATGLKLALLINFNVPLLRQGIRRSSLGPFFVPLWFEPSARGGSKGVDLLR